MFLYNFDFNATAQAVAAILKTQDDLRMRYIRVIKLLYLADRSSIAETGRPISRGPVAAMEHGPVHSVLYDLVKGSQLAEQARWSQFFATDGMQLRMLRDPGADRLSAYQLETIRRTVAAHADKSWGELVDFTHTLPEWQKNDPGRSSRPLPVEDILEAVGRGDEAHEILRVAQEEEERTALFDAIAKA